MMAGMSRPPSPDRDPGPNALETPTEWMRFDSRMMPLSMRGSYLAIMKPPKEAHAWCGTESLCLRQHRGRTASKREVFTLEMVDDQGAVVASEAWGCWQELEQRPSEMWGPGGRVTDGSGDAGPVVSYVFDGPNRIRIRGRKVRLRLSTEPGGNVVTHPSPLPCAPSGSEQDGSLQDRAVIAPGEEAEWLDEPSPEAIAARGGLWVVNVRQSIGRFGFEALRGRLTVDSPWQAIQSKHTHVLIEPDETGEFELAVDYFQTTWVRRRRKTFAACLQRTQRDALAWLAEETAAPPELELARQKASYTNWSALVEPLGLLTRPTMLMSKVVMDQVWSWDHCFNAMALAAGRPELAWDQLWTVIDHQDEFGAFPDAVNPLFKHYNFSKPPVLGWATGIMRRANPAWFNAERLGALYEPMARWTRWWLAYRIPPGEKLPFYLHGNDSGWDNSTMFDVGAPLVAPDLAALLSLQMEQLAVLAAEQGRGAEADDWLARSLAMRAQLIAELWQGDGFVARRHRDGLMVKTHSLIPLIPLVLGRRLPKQISSAMVRRLPEFLTEHGPATERPDSEQYEPNGYWRGPIWAPPTMLLFTGLLDLGETDLAGQLAQRFTRTCANSSMAENFDALTGRPLRDTAYTWTASVFLLLAQWLAGEGPFVERR